MDDWAKIVLGGAGGFVLGILAEPIKHYLQARTRIKQLEASVYSEMAENYEAIWRYLRTCDSHYADGPRHGTVPLSNMELTTERFQQVKSDILYPRLPNVRAISYYYNTFIDMLQRWKKSERIPQQDYMDAARSDWNMSRGILMGINMEMLDKGKLNNKLFFSFLQDATVTWFKGDRSWKASLESLQSNTPQTPDPPPDSRPQ